MRWTYGVMTVPARRKTLLPATLKSLAYAGFPEPRLFVDGCDHRLALDYEAEFSLQVTCHSPVISVHGNWALAMLELFIREPHAQRYAMFQDDLVALRDTRQYLERLDYPDPPQASVPGYWNLYSAPSNQVIAPARNGFYLSNQCGKGALALVFSREALLTLFSSRHFVERPCCKIRGKVAVDGGIVSAMLKAGWKEYVHNPSLVMHTGWKTSTLDKKWDESHYKKTSFPGEGITALSLA
jgi:hypothetical protein